MPDFNWKIASTFAVSYTDMALFFLEVNKIIDNELYENRKKNSLMQSNLSWHICNV